ncbi:MAG: serine hydrolase domain-containing protein, partial [Terriglobales bacterium]
LNDLDEHLLTIFKKHHLAGLTVGILVNGQVVHSKCLGMADLRSRSEVCEYTTFRIGSISKTFTAVALMQLWERGLLHLESPVNDFLKAYKIVQPPLTPPITFRHLLTHTSGIGELRRWTDLFRPTLGLTISLRRPSTLREYYAPALRAELPPGSKWAYSNHGFTTLGQVIEDVSGQPFAEYMLEHVFAPLGMMHTDFQMSWRVTPRFAQGYEYVRRTLRNIANSHIVIAPAVAAVSNLEDMLLYLAAMAGNGANRYGRVIDAETLELMSTPHYVCDPRMPSNGLGFMIETRGDRLIFGHDLGWPGYSGSIRVAPQVRAAVVVLTNTAVMASGFATITIANEVVGRLVDDRFPDSVEVSESPDLWAQLCGSYRPERGFYTNLRIWRLLGGRADIVIRDGHLEMRTPLGPSKTGMLLRSADQHDPLLFRGHLNGLDIWVLFRRNKSGVVVSLSVSSTAICLNLYKKL